ncbi:MAG TPA: hypothetical protein VNH18_37350 [Bryobacteraceae bacterium]|nr:hypothetical protein [Bryobacteraceae bacterium]
MTNRERLALDINRRNLLYLFGISAASPLFARMAGTIGKVAVANPGQSTETIQALAFRAADRITMLAKKGEI